MADDGDRSRSLWAVAILFAVLTWLTVILRVYVRVEQIGKFGIDDKILVVAQIFFTGYLVCQMGGLAYGTGKRLALLDYGSAETALRFWFFCELWYALSSTTVKVAICLSLLRVTIRKTHKWIIYGLISWSVSLGASFFLVVVFQCRPVSDWWSLDPNQKNCISPQSIVALTYTVSALTVASDWSLGLFPFFVVRDLSIPLYQKILVASILAFGAIASTATVVRIWYAQTMDQTYEGWNGDFLYDSAPVALLATVECGVGITAISLSTLRPLITKFMHYIRPNTYDSRSQRYARRQHSHESPPPIPLVINPHTGMPQSFHAARSSSASRDEYAGVSHFNQTKPLDSSIISLTEADDDDSYYKKPSSPSRQPHHTAQLANFSTPPTSFTASQMNATRFNPTRTLTSTFGDVEDEIHPVKHFSRRFG